MVRAALALPQGARLELVGGKAPALRVNRLAFGGSPLDHVEGAVSLGTRHVGNHGGGQY